MSHLKEVDPKIYDAIQKETKRQAYTIELIASENFVSDAVLEAMGSVMTNKYAEGYPGKRYYGGCEYVDIGEDLARKRAKELFDCDHVNVQPHSGTQANIAAYMTFLDIGDTIMGLNLSHGGHLSHGHPINFSGMYYNVVQYTVNKDTEVLDYDELMELAKENEPKLIVAGASAYPRTLHFDKFKEIADEVGAKLMVDIAHIAGLVATGVHPSPIPYADVVTTTTHKTLRGPRGGMIMCKEEYAKKLDKIVFPGGQGGPLMHIIAAKAVSFEEALKPEFKQYQQQIVKNAATLANEFKKRDYHVVADGTDTHLFLLNVLDSKGISGKAAERALELSGITVNKNTVPFDKKSPFVTSGIRVGTPAVTTRGMKEDDMKQIAEWMDEIMTLRSEFPKKEHREKRKKVYNRVKEEVKEFCKKFPLYENRIDEKE